MLFSNMLACTLDNVVGFDNTILFQRSYLAVEERVERPIAELIDFRTRRQSEDGEQCEVQSLDEEDHHAHAKTLLVQNISQFVFNSRNKDKLIRELFPELETE